MPDGRTFVSEKTLPGKITSLGERINTRPPLQSSSEKTPLINRLMLSGSILVQAKKQVGKMCSLLWEV